MQDTIFEVIQEHAIHILKFSKRDKEGNWIHKQYSKDYLLNWSIKHYKEWDNVDFGNMEEEAITNLLELKVLFIDNWVEEHYKSKEYIKNYNAKYYTNTTKVKHNHIDQKIHLKRVQKARSDKNYNKVLEAYNACQKAKVKPTIAKIIEISELSNVTVQKHLKSIKKDMLN